MEENPDMKLKFAALCASVAILNACGGGGGSGGESGTPQPPAATPAPAPAPAPITYTPFAEITDDREFNAACSGLRDNSNQSLASPFNADFTIALAQQNETWTIAGETPTGESFDSSFDENDIVEELRNRSIRYAVDTDVFIPPNSTIQDLFAIFVPQTDEVRSQFVRVATGTIFPTDADVQESFRCVFGVATQAADSLPSSTVTYSANVDLEGGAQGASQAINGLGIYNLDASTITITLDLANDRLDYVLSLRGRELVQNVDTDDSLVFTQATFPLAELSGSAAVSEGTQGFSGTVVDESGQVIGEINGAFFGPQGAEIGIAIEGRDQRQDASFLTFNTSAAGPQDSN